MIELNKQELCVGERSIAVFSQAYCESDMIVPDVKPDIAKLLQWDATVAVTSKLCHTDRISIEGKANVTILYLGENGCVCGMTVTQPFSHIIDAKGVTEGMEADIETDVENVDCSMINSRKLSVKVLIGVDANAATKVEAALCTGIQGDLPHETLCKTIKPYTTVCRGQDQVCIKERLDLPAGKPCIDSVLCVRAKITGKETKPIHDKIIMKGTLCVTTLYLGDMEDNNVQFMEHELPFSEVVEAPGVDDSMEVQTRCCVAQVYHDVEEDSDGDRRMLTVECLIDVAYKACCETQVEVIEDAYCTKAPLMLARETATIDRLVTETKNQVTIKDAAALEEGTPDIMQVYNVIARPYVATTKIDQGKVVIEGMIDVHILYLSTDVARPVCSAKHQCPFSQQLDVEGIDDSMVCDINLDVNHVNYNLSMNSEVELRFVLDIGAKIITTEDIVYITDAQQGEVPDEGTKAGCCIRIYFVRKGDRLWDIAKKYGTTMERILAANDMAAESELYAGRQLMIR